VRIGRNALTRGLLASPQAATWGTSVACRADAGGETTGIRKVAVRVDAPVPHFHSACQRAGAEHRRIRMENSNSGRSRSIRRSRAVESTTPAPAQRVMAVKAAELLRMGAEIARLIGTVMCFQPDTPANRRGLEGARPPS